MHSRSRALANFDHSSQQNLISKGSRLVSRLRHSAWGAPNLSGVKDQLPDLRVGYFGASTGGGAALVAAAQLDESVGAVLSRGGRPDLAADLLPRVQSPTLLIVGGFDSTVIELNKIAYERLRCEKQLHVVPGASHLFEEPGTLDQVARLVADWFQRHLIEKNRH